MTKKPYGIAYKATCRISGKSYIGITKRSLNRRWSAHVLRATSGERGGCTALAAAIRKYGKEQFIVEAVACSATPEHLMQTEILLIKQDQTLSPDGYNLCAGGQGQLEPSPETRARMRASHLGKKQSPELIAKRTAGQKGRKRSAAAIEQARAKQLGTKRKSWGRHTAESKAKMSAKRKAAICTPEMRAAMSARIKKNPIPRPDLERRRRERAQQLELI